LTKSKNPTKKTAYNFEDGEIIPIDKPIGWTSFDVVNKIRKALRIRKAGHTGTLDPFASGLLIVLTGKKTKLAPTFINLPKTYEGIIELGVETDTLDVDGKVIGRKDVAEFSPDEIESALKRFEGESFQIPPSYSAVKIGGTRAYKYARQNQPVKLAPRKIHIYSIRLLGYSERDIHFSVTCSKGTYVRALARDVAKALGTIGYLKSLRRCRIGDYSVERAWDIDAFIDWVLSLKQVSEKEEAVE